MNMAAISTAAAAEPGRASVKVGIMAPGMTAELPVSAAIRPSWLPLPNRCLSLLVRLAAA
ncbi:hypothetical protein D3C87_2089350 [compost metagenome]